MSLWLAGDQAEILPSHISVSETNGEGYSRLGSKVPAYAYNPF